MLEVNNIVVYYGKALALKGVSLGVNEGEIVALIGANGAGKTTTLRAITGMVKVASGKVIFKGNDITNLPSYKIALLGITHVPEDRGLFPDMTVMENLEMGAYLRRDTDSIKEDLEYVFSLFPRLKERKDQLAGTLSGGEQQMLALAKGLMARPKLLLLDEPSVGLAPYLVDQIFDAILEINKKRGVTILIAEQNAYMALQCSSRAYVIENGTVALSGPSKELMDNPYLKKSYLGL
ncbi:ABC transporter ATP-binding protein [Thermofilum sp.]|uniref:ABC transporter ATP-binding protein n=1 Tax=Thermofilum sp. TaxID=1961369 RepID=UPI00319D9FB2